ncbi:hypothetical protein NDU88_006932 [Pleurodeles waltl]|uniref:Uncharacterized protein n=1 Tax=Pleurodeles waltl TaxID=8319 RepID=A0AAV7RQD7_PLEWA|nr:hypothetical protein NDU88_006932 [Pleurodeles waltl]
MPRRRLGQAQPVCACQSPDEAELSYPPWFFYITAAVIAPDLPVFSCGDRHLCQALERAPRRSAARGRATAEFRLEGRRRRGCVARGESRPGELALGPGLETQVRTCGEAEATVALRQLGRDRWTRQARPHGPRRCADWLSGAGPPNLWDLALSASGERGPGH